MTDQNPRELNALRNWQISPSPQDYYRLLKDLENPTLQEECKRDPRAFLLKYNIDVPAGRMPRTVILPPVEALQKASTYVQDQIYAPTNYNEMHVFAGCYFFEPPIPRPHKVEE